MKNIRTGKGITLVALIITIIVLLILAIVAISAVSGDGILEHAKEATEKTKLAQQEESIRLALDEWKIQSNIPGNTQEFADFMAEKLTDETSVTETTEGVLTIAFGTNLYSVQANGSITTIKSLGIAASTEDPLVIEEGEAMPTVTLTATLVGVEGTITWSIQDISIATLSATEGTEITVTAVAPGETVVTATCGDASNTYTVVINEPENIIAVPNEEDIVVGTTTIPFSHDGTDANLKNWLVISKDTTAKTIEIISPQALESLTLGVEDTTINWNMETPDATVAAAIAEAEIDGTEGISDIEKAIYSYNHAIDTINNKCKEAVTNTATNIVSVKSIGAATDPTSANDTYKDIPTEWSTAATYNGKAKVGDNIGVNVNSTIWSRIKGGYRPVWVAARRVNNLAESEKYIGFNLVSDGSGGSR